MVVDPILEESPGILPVGPYVHFHPRKRRATTDHDQANSTPLILFSYLE